MDRGADGLARFVGVNLHVVADAVRGEESVNTARREQFFADDFGQHLLRIDEELARFLAMLLVIEDGRINAAQFPRVEERCPVNERGEVFEADRSWRVEALKG